MKESEILPLVASLASLLTSRGWFLATAESCTGGWIAKCCTDMSGSSAWFDRGFVTYSNEAKCELLGIPADLITREGAVSETVARAMAEGALAKSHADLVVAITGIAGPGGGTPEKPVGLVYIALVGPDGLQTVQRHQWDGDREAIKDASATAALQLIVDSL